VTCKRLEAEGLLAELGGTLDAHVEQCEDCRARLRGYQRLAGLIATGATARQAPADWKARTQARVRAAARAQRRRRIVGLGAAAVAAVAAAAIVLPPWFRGGGGARQPEEPSLALQLGDDPAVTHHQRDWRGEVHVGTQLRAHAIPAGQPYFEVRVYRGARELLLRCPQAGPPACLEADRSMLVWTIPSVATYQVLFLVAARPIAAPRGSLDDDVAAATAGGARVIEVQTLHVR
jgi:hypothetical protein